VIAPGALQPQLNPSPAALILAASKPDAAAFLQAGEEIASQAL